MIDDMMINRRPQKQHLQFLLKKKIYGRHPKCHNNKYVILYVKKINLVKVKNTSYIIHQIHKIHHNIS